MRAEHLQASHTTSHVPGADNSLLILPRGANWCLYNSGTKSAWKHQGTSSEELNNTDTNSKEPPCPLWSPFPLIHLSVAQWVFECSHFKPAPPRLFTEEPGARAHSPPYSWRGTQASLYQKKKTKKTKKTNKQHQKLFPFPPCSPEEREAPSPRLNFLSITGQECLGGAIMETFATSTPCYFISFFSLSKS